MTKSCTSFRAVLGSLALLLTSASEAKTFMFPTVWEFYGTSWSVLRYVRPIASAPSVAFDVPDVIADRLMRWGDTWAGNNTGIYIADIAYPLWPTEQPILGIPGQTVYTLWAYNPARIFAIVHPTINPTCLKWGVVAYARGGPTPNDKTWIFEAPCFPITILDPNTCSISSTDVTLDHGTVTLGRPSRATASFDISCKKSGSGRISLPSGSANVPIGGGFATLSTDRGPLSTSLIFPEGSSTIQLVSTLTDVQSGVWSASTVITLDMD